MVRPDEEIIDALWNRNEEGLTTLSRKYGNLCHSVIQRILPQAEDGEECLNELLLKVWNAIPPYRPTNLRAYVCKIARQISLDKYRYLHRQKRKGTEMELIEAELAGLLSGSDLVTEHMDALELKAALNRFLSSLPNIERTIFLRRYWQFQSMKEIAIAQEMNINTVKTHLHRTKQSLRTFLEKEGFEL